LIGRKFSHYRIIKKLGQGGMGEVYLAEDAELGRKVALKILPAGATSTVERSARFLREAKAASALNHPNIVTIYESRETEGVHYIAMEYVEGQTLADLVPHGGLDTAAILNHAIPLTDGLNKAHEAGIIHRDLKLDNIMVSKAGQAKILDFGLAKLKEVPQRGDTELPTRTRGPHLTEEGAILGTFAYMSPEQAEGRELDARSDIFSFGCVLYQMATGRHPFTGDSGPALLASVLKDQPSPIRDLRADHPAELERIIRKCMNKDPNKRYGSMHELQVDLEMLRDDVHALHPQRPVASGGIAPARIPTAYRERLAWLISAVLLAVVVALALLHLQSRQGVAPTLIRIATATPTQVFHSVGTGIAEVLEKKLPDIQARVLVTDGSVENVKLLDQAEAELGFAVNVVAFNAVKTNLVLGHRSTTIAGLAALYTQVVQVVVFDDSGIRTLDDLRGKTVNLGLPGSGDRFTSSVILSHFGIGPRDVHDDSRDLPEALQALQDRSLSAVVLLRGVPDVLVSDLFRRGKYKLLSIDPELLNGLRVNQPFLAPATIPAGVYPGQDRAVTSVGAKAVLVASTSVSEDLAEQVLNAMFESIPDLIAHHPRAADISLMSAFRVEDGMPIDLHPGAARFYRSQMER
jgi:TRAP transporter TAXI family solute receptor